MVNMPGAEATNALQSSAIIMNFPATAATSASLQHEPLAIEDPESYHDHGWPGIGRRPVSEVPMPCGGFCVKVMS